LEAHGAIHDADGSFRIHFRNGGAAAAVFHVRSGFGAEVPRTYTVGAHAHIADDWNVTSIGAPAYDLSVYGPNGFYRRFAGDVSGRHRADLDVRAVYDERTTGIALQISNRAAHVARVSVLASGSTRSLRH
jgi:phospholipase C